MKNIPIITSIIAVCFSVQAQNIDISNDWQFEVGDNPEWAQSSTDDSKWKTMKTLGFVEDNGYPDFKGFAWFRKKIIIPSSLRANAEKYGAVNLVLGGIDDSDQGFFNGKIVGESGKMPPNDYVTGYYTFRIYTIDIKDILWDKENIIAVRLYDNLGSGGFYKGPYMVSIRNGELFKLTGRTVAGFNPTESEQIWTKSIKIPSSFKPIAEKNNGVKMKTNLPGTAKFFLNSKFVDESIRSKNHEVFVPLNAIKWDSDNDLKVYLDKNAAVNEIFLSDIVFSDAIWTDVVRVKNQSMIQAQIQTGSPLDVKLEITNQSFMEFKGTLSVELVSDIYKIETTATQDLQLKKGAVNTVNFKLNSNFAGVYKLNYRLVDQSGRVLVGQLAAGVFR